MCGSLFFFSPQSSISLYILLCALNAFGVIPLTLKSSPQGEFNMLAAFQWCSFHPLVFVSCYCCLQMIFSCFLLVSCIFNTFLCTIFVYGSFLFLLFLVRLCTHISRSSDPTKIFSSTSKYINEILAIRAMFSSSCM